MMKVLWERLTTREGCPYAEAAADIDGITVYAMCAIDKYATEEQAQKYALRSLKRRNDGVFIAGDRAIFLGKEHFVVASNTATKVATLEDGGTKIDVHFSKLGFT